MVPPGSSSQLYQAQWLAYSELYLFILKSHFDQTYAHAMWKQGSMSWVTLFTSLFLSKLSLSRTKDKEKEFHYHSSVCACLLAHVTPLHPPHKAFFILLFPSLSLSAEKKDLYLTVYEEKRA